MNMIMKINVKCIGLEKLRNEMIKIHEAQGRRGFAGNYPLSRLLTQSASAITWQSTKIQSPFPADSKMSRPPATRSAAAAAKTTVRGARRGVSTESEIKSSNRVGGRCKSGDNEGGRKSRRDDGCAGGDNRGIAIARFV